MLSLASFGLLINFRSHPYFSFPLLAGNIATVQKSSTLGLLLFSIYTLCLQGFIHCLILIFISRWKTAWFDPPVLNTFWKSIPSSQLSLIYISTWMGCQYLKLHSCKENRFISSHLTWSVSIQPESGTTMSTWQIKNALWELDFLQSWELAEGCLQYCCFCAWYWTWNPSGQPDWQLEKKAGHGQGQG